MTESEHEVQFQRDYQLALNLVRLLQMRGYRPSRVINVLSMALGVTIAATPNDPAEVSWDQIRGLIEHTIKVEREMHNDDG